LLEEWEAIPKNKQGAPEIEMPPKEAILLEEPLGLSKK
jgi:hypothetical protein